MNVRNHQVHKVTADGIQRLIEEKNVNSISSIFGIDSHVTLARTPIYQVSHRRQITTRQKKQGTQIKRSMLIEPMRFIRAVCVYRGNTIQQSHRPDKNAIHCKWSNQSSDMSTELVDQQWK